MESESKTILKRDGDIGILLIHNPPENYLEHPDFIGINELKSFVETGIKALVVAGTGRHFCAGADLKIMKKQIEKINVFQQELEKGNELLNAIDDLEIPVIAAISGICFGAGLETALASDIRIADENALFSFPEVNHDLMPGMGGIKRLAEIAGHATALEMVMNGDMISAEKAFNLKIIDALVPKKKALSSSLELAKKTAANRPVYVINSIMKSINFAKTHSREESVKNDAELFSALALKTFQENK